MDADELRARIGALETELAMLRKACEDPQPGELLKFDDEKRIAFGWGYVAKDRDGRQVVDWSGDVVSEAGHLEKAAYDFVLNSRAGDAHHDSKPIATLVESVVFTPEKLRALGVPAGVLPSAGWWTGMKVHDDRTWDDVRSGKLKAFSVGGRGVRVAIR